MCLMQKEHSQKPPHALPSVSLDTDWILIAIHKHTSARAAFEVARVARHCLPQSHFFRLFILWLHNRKPQDCLSWTVAEYSWCAERIVVGISCLHSISSTRRWCIGECDPLQTVARSRFSCRLHFVFSNAMCFLSGYFMNVTLCVIPTRTHWSVTDRRISFKT